MTKQERKCNGYTDGVGYIYEWTAEERIASLRKDIAEFETKQNDSYLSESGKCSYRKMANAARKELAQLEANS